jgi:hypothetical protein
MLAASQTGNDLADTIARFLTAAGQGKVPLMGNQRVMLQVLTRGSQHTEKMRGRFKLLLQHVLSRLAASAEAGQRSGVVKTKVEADLIAAWLVAGALGLASLLDLGIEIDVARIQRSARELLQIEPG